MCHIHPCLKDDEYSITTMNGLCDYIREKYDMKAEFHGKIDDRYPQRIGRVVKLDIDYIEIGYPLIIQYIIDSDGTSMKFSLLKTSCVKNYITINDLEGIVKYITIETENSIFEFVKVDDE